MKPPSALVSALFVALSVAPENNAAAYVRSRSGESCSAVYWKQSCVFVQPDSRFVADLPAQDVERIIQKSLNNWMSKTTGSFVKLHFLPADGVKETTYKDHLSVVVFRSGSRFCRPATQSGDQGGEFVCYDSSAAAVTTVSYVNKKGDPSDGRIVDADIEMNAVNNQFVEIGKPLPPMESRNQTDLENTLTHELGHLLGLDHTCRLGTDSSCLTDDKGQPRLLCDTIDKLRSTNPAYQTIYETAMFAIAPAKDVEKRTPKADDIAGVNAASPLDKDPKICEQPGTGESSGCSCQSANRSPSAVASLCVALLLLGVLRRKRKGFAMKKETGSE